MGVKIAIDHDRIAEFCRRWKVSELALFGSVLREDFAPESDIDVLVSFEPDDKWDVFDVLKMQKELGEIFGREVDLVLREALVNPFRRQHILRTKRVIHVA